nr:hypothetical protein [Alkalilimnicola ehrlichii]
MQPLSLPRSLRHGCCALLLLALTGPASAEERSIVDDMGHTVRLSAPAERIVSLAPHASEMLFAAGAGDAIVGAVEYTDYPPQAVEIPRVAATSPSTTSAFSRYGRI